MIDLILKDYQETNSISNEDLEQVISHYKMLLDGVRALKDPEYFLFERDILDEYNIFLDYKRHREENFSVTPTK
jgi:hypothetical protein